MPGHGFKIVIRRVEKPFSHGFDEEFNWICRTFGFFEPIDRDKTASTLFKEIVKATDCGKPLTSTQLAERSEMSRGSVINHLNNLMRSGFVERRGRLYIVRSRSMQRTVEELEEDILRIFREVKRTAREIDEELGIAVEE